MIALYYLRDEAFDLKLFEYFLLVKLRVDNFVEFKTLLPTLAQSGF